MVISRKSVHRKQLLHQTIFSEIILIFYIVIGKISEAATDILAVLVYYLANKERLINL